MERPITCILGVLFTVLAVTLRLDVGNMFTAYSWSGNAIVISRDYQYMRAWIDVLNIAIVTGIAMAILGWLVPPRRPPRTG
jgi:hypothetical protein